MLITMFVLYFSFPNNIAVAIDCQSPNPCADLNNNEYTDCQSLVEKECSGTLKNPLGENATNIAVIYGRIIYTFLGISGALALIIFLYGGLTWMTSAGNEEKVKIGKETLIWGILGLAVIFSSYAILRTIFQNLQF